MLVQIILLSAAIYLLYRWATKNYQTFENRGIPYTKPLPLLGNAAGMLRKRASFHKFMINLYRNTKQHKVFGIYNLRDPFYIINDPALIKKIAVKDFNTFPNHQLLISENDPLLQNMLSVMRDQRWKDMRTTLTPIFTGAKMRTMFALMLDCFEGATNYIYQQAHGADSIEVEMKDCFARMSNDLIATTAFGIKVNSFDHPENEFYTIGQKFTKTRGTHLWKFIVYSLTPKLFKVLGMKLFDESMSSYFERLVLDAFKYREEHNIIRPDMIHLLMDAKKESDHNWSDRELVAQCLIFFFAAFENNAKLICTTCQELMENPHVHDRLYEEIMETHRELNGKPLDYDALKRMKYMDMVVSESLRKWPLAPVTDRECSKDYTLTDDDGNYVCDLKKGDHLWFPIIGIQWDEENFEHPEIFDPERFSDENKKKQNQLSYIPFGIGPRNCIGDRYALMQAKAMLYYLLKDFKLERSPKSCKSLWEDASGRLLLPKDGLWLKLSKRIQSTEL